jgi:hypothetical protein
MQKKVKRAIEQSILFGALAKQRVYDLRLIA